MGDWYTLGLAAGLAAAAGVLLSGVLGRAPRGVAVTAVLALAAGLAIGFGAGTFARGAVRRGGTPGGTAAIFVAAAVLALALSFIPIVGFIEAIAIPVVGLRSRQRADEKYAGLRTLAK